jgi:hypothetical protein
MNTRQYQVSERTIDFVEWYKSNRDRISAALPLTIGPATYSPSFIDSMDTWVGMAPTLSRTLADAYICIPLEKIQAALGDADPVAHDVVPGR